MRRRLGKTTNPKLSQDVRCKLDNMVRQMSTQKVRRRLGKWQVKANANVKRRLEKLVWQKLTQNVRRRLGKTANRK